MEPGPPPHPQQFQDAEHLKLLAIFHYVLAALTFIGGSFPIIHVITGWMMVSGRIPMAPASGGGPPPEQIGWLFIAMGGVFILLFWTVAVMLFLAGRFLSARRNRTFCFVIACLSCAGFPLGTALGVFTILVLQRPSVRALFDRPQPGGYSNR
jgi:hypothetical protein